MIARVLATTGAEVSAVGRHPRKLALLRDAGIEAVDADAVPAARFDLAVECTGHPDGFAVAPAGGRTGDAT